MSDRPRGQDPSRGSSLGMRRGLLYALIGSVILGALLGILVVLRGDWGWFEIRVILTTITIALASLFGLACDLVRTPRGANFLPKAGLGLTLLSTILLLVAIWLKNDGEWFLKTTVSACILTAATVHVCLLSIAKLAHRFRWVRVVAVQAIYGLAALLIVMLIWEMGDDDRMFRFIVTVAIINAALTLIIPLLHRISRIDQGEMPIQTLFEEKNLAAVDEEIARLKDRLARLEALKARLEKP